MLSADENSSFCRIFIDPSSNADFLDIVSSLIVPLFIGTLSFNQLNVKGKSPVPTTHWTLTRSPTFTSFANSNGVIFGGTLGYDSKCNFIFGANFIRNWMVQFYYLQGLVQFE